MPKRLKKPKAPEELIRRDPAEEGEFESGCFYHDSNNLALVAEHNSRVIFEATDVLFLRWDAFMLELVTSKLSGHPDVKREAFAWILAHAAELYEAVKKEAAWNEEEIAPTTANVDRDWFCWLYRHFVSKKKDLTLDQ